MDLRTVQHPDYAKISRQFRHTNVWRDDQPLVFPSLGVAIYNLSFTSANAHYLLGHPAYHCSEHDLVFGGESTVHAPTDALIVENIRFRYPLVREDCSAGSPPRLPQVVIVLHGLNERSYSKYIPWAYFIGKAMGCAVILFPLTFHINRVLPAWGHEQRATFTARKSMPGNENAHRFNAIISDRLGSHPERFFWGAVQSYWDLVDLARAIRSGAHPHVAPDARIDLVGYSAGGFLALALLLENTEGLYSESRSVIFASCAAIRDVNLSSHLIVDHLAEVAMMKLFVKYKEKLATDRMKHWLEQHPEGKWMDAFLGLMPDRTRLEARLRTLAPRLLGITNSNDQVMPPGAMLNALQGIRRDTGVRVEELPLGIHENPFSSPDYNQQDRKLMTEFLDRGKYGRGFEQFIDLIVGHFRRST